MLVVRPCRACVEKRAVAVEYAVSLQLSQDGGIQKTEPGDVGSRRRDQNN